MTCDPLTMKTTPIVWSNSLLTEAGAPAKARFSGPSNITWRSSIAECVDGSVLSTDATSVGRLPIGI